MRGRQQVVLQFAFHEIRRARTAASRVAKLLKQDSVRALDSFHQAWVVSAPPDRITCAYHTIKTHTIVQTMPRHAIPGVCCRRRNRMRRTFGSSFIRIECELVACLGSCYDYNTMPCYAVMPCLAMPCAQRVTRTAREG